MNVGISAFAFGLSLVTGDSWPCCRWTNVVLVIGDVIVVVSKIAREHGQLRDQDLMLMGAGGGGLSVGDH